MLLRQKLVVVRAGTENDFALAFETIVRERVEALFVNLDPFLSAQRDKNPRASLTAAIFLQ